MVTEAEKYLRDQQVGAQPVPANQPTTPTQPATDTTEAEPQESWGKRSLRRAGQDAVSTLGAPQALYGLSGALWDMATKDDISFLEASMSEQGRELFDAANNGVQAAAHIVNENPTALLRTGLQSAAEWYETGGELTGVTYNEDGSVPLDEEAGGIALSTLLTLPFAPTKLVTLPAKGALMGARGAAIAAKGAIGAAEMITPVTFGGKGAIATNMVVQEGINDAIRYAMDEPTLTGTVLAGTDEYTQGSITPDSGLPVEGTMAEDAAVLGGAGLAAVAGLNAGKLARGIGARLGRIKPDTPPSASMPRPEETALGELPARNTSEGITDTANAYLDEGAVLTEGVKRTLGEDAGEAFEDLRRANTGQAAEANFNRYAEAGMLRNDGSIRTIPLRALKRTYNGMDKQTRQAFDNTMLALDELQNIERGVKSATNVEPSVLRKRVQYGMKQPGVPELVQMYDRTTRSFSELRYKTGIIDTEQFGREVRRAFNAKTGSGGYVPIIESPQSLNWPTRARNWLTTGDQRGGRSGVLQYEKQRQGGRNIVREKPIDALEQYTREQLREVGNMAVRRSFLKSVNNAPVQAFPSGRKIVRQVSKPSGRTMTIRDFGKEKHYEVGDDRIRTALQFRPNAVIPLASDMRRWFQQGTTGFANPLFAPVSLVYDAMFGMLTARNDKIVTGILDQMLAQRGASVGLRQALAGVTRPAELTFTVLEGLFEGATGRYKMIVAQRMMQRAAMDGNPVAAGKAAEAADTFAKSKYGLMHMSGNASHNYLDDIVEANGLFNKLVDRASGTLTAQVYTHGLETLRDAYRMGIYARNVSAAQFANKGKPLTKKDYDKAARITRDVASDPTKRGASQAMNAITSTMPYANVILQSAAHLARQFDNPAAYSVMAGTVMFRYAMYNSLSPEAREFVDKRTPDYKRTAMMPIEQARTEGEAFDPVKHIEWVPLGPELGTITSMAMSLLDGMFMGQEDNMSPGALAQMRTAAGDLFGFAVPPAINFAVTGFGYGQVQPGALLDNREGFRQPNDDGGMPEFRGTGMNAGAVSDRMHNMVYSALGTAGRTIMDAAEVIDSGMNRVGKDFSDAASDAAGVVLYETVKRQTVGTLFGDAAVRTSMGTPQTDRVYEINDQLDRIATIQRAITPNVENPWDADIPSNNPLDNLPDKVTDPNLRFEMRHASMYFRRPSHAQALDKVAELRKAYRRASGDTRVSVEERNTVLNNINGMMQDHYAEILDSYGAFEDDMIRMTNNPDWSLRDLVDRIEDDLL